MTKCVVELPYIVTGKLEAKMSAEKFASELRVAILPLGNVPLRQVTLTMDVLEEKFGVTIILLPAMEIPAQYFHAEPYQDQIDLDKILDFLFFQIPVNAQRIIGVVEENLGVIEMDDRFHPVLGYAYPDHRAAIYSASYLSEQQFGLGESRLDQNSISNLIIHELAHTFGVKHCDNPECAMNETVFKTTLCAKCRRWVDRELKVKPGSAEECFSRAEALCKHDCLHEAIAAYREAILRAPNEPLYHHCLSLALRLAEQSDTEDYAQVRAIMYSDDYPDFYYNLGLKHLRNDLTVAEEYFAKAIAAAKNPQNMQRLVGQAYREITHDVERASRHYLEYLRLGGNDQDVVEWLISRSKLNRP